MPLLHRYTFFASTHCLTKTIENPTIASLPYTDALPKSDGYLIFGFLLPALVHEYPATDRKKLRRRRLKDAEPKQQNGGKFNLELYVLEIFL